MKTQSRKGTVTNSDVFGGVAYILLRRTRPRISIDILQVIDIDNRPRISIHSVVLVCSVHLFSSPNQFGAKSSLKHEILSTDHYADIFSFTML